MAQVQISIFLDKRRAKKSGKFPLKIRAFTAKPRVQKLYPTGLELTSKEFESSYLSEHPRGENRRLRMQILAYLNRAAEISEGLEPFNFEQFGRKFLRESGDGLHITTHYDEVFENLTKRGQVGTADTYRLSFRSLEDFVIHRKNKRSLDSLTFAEISPDFLKDFEQYMTEDKGRSLTTVSIYLRVLRAVFNKAIEEGEIPKEIYPFGKRKYQLPSPRNVKKALSKEDLKKLLEAAPKTKDQEKARDFWFFSFACNGMNMKDIALMKRRNLSQDLSQFEFIREKTKNTSRGDMKSITLFLNGFAQEVLSKYGSLDMGQDSLIFDIVSPGASPEQQKREVKAFTRFVNQHMKKLAESLGVDSRISTYWARHSFATNAIRKGASMEFIQESLGHGDLKTTKNYFAGFDQEAKKEFSENLMKFD